MVRPTKETRRLREESIATLREWLPPGTTVYCIVRSISKTGMSRNISLVYFEAGSDRHPCFHVARAIDWPYVETGGYPAIRVHGAGMDMCAHLVSELSAVLYGDEKALKHRTL